MYKAVFAANCVLWLCFAFLLPSCTNNEGEKPASTDKLKDYRDLGGIAKIAPGWRGEVIAKTDQSYVGLDVEIGDADNDGKNEILTTGSPNSRLYLFQKSGDRWRTHILYENLARYTPGLGLSVEIVDLNADGKNEVICGTGHELNTNGPAIFYVFQTNGEKITKKLISWPHVSVNYSRYTHGLATHDVDADGVLEVISAYCGWGQVLRYDVDKDLSKIDVRRIHQLSASGEATLISDVDNDGKVELVVVTGFKFEGEAKVEIFEFDKKGELIKPARIVIDGFDDYKCFQASIVVGDVNNDGNNELVIAWKRKEKINKTTILGYSVGEKATSIYTFSYEDEDLDTGIFERAMSISDADNDEKNELIVSTVGDTSPKAYSTASEGLGHVFMFTVGKNGTVQKNLILDFNKDKAQSSWFEVGDADNDGENEIVLATGKGERREPGISYVVLVEKE